MSHLGEFELIERIAAACHPAAPSCHPERSEGSPASGTPAECSGVVGIGDDCAVLPQRDGVDTLVTTDLLVEGRHFLLEDVTPFELGWKSAAVNISDIAAMGGKPVASFLSIALPKHLSVPSTETAGNEDGGAKNGIPSTETADNEDGRPDNGVPSKNTAENVDGTVEWVDRFIAGFRELSGRFGVPLLGGDTSASPDKLFINVTVLGECPHGQAVLRSGARPGDLICVSGPLGDSAAGLKLILERAEASKPCPRVSTDGPLGTKMAEFLPKGAGAGGNQQSVQGYDEATRSRPWLREREGPSRQTGRNERSEGLAHHTPEPASMLISRHYLPVPRVELGQQLAATPGVHAMMDISDGIASDLRHILKASASDIDANRARSRFSPDTLPGNLRSAPLNGTLPCKVPTSKLDLAQVSVLGAEIDLNALPLSEELRAVCAERGWDAAELAVSGGEDYELLFTVAPGTELPEGCTVIGRIVDSRSEPAIRWIGTDKDFKGFTHF